MPGCGRLRTFGSPPLSLGLGEWARNGRAQGTVVCKGGLGLAVARMGGAEKRRARGPRAQRESTTDSSPVSERRERSERSEFGDGAAGPMHRARTQIVQWTVCAWRRTGPLARAAGQPERQRRPPRISATASPSLPLQEGPSRHETGSNTNDRNGPSTVDQSIFPTPTTADAMPPDRGTPAGARRPAAMQHRVPRARWHR